MTAGKGVTTFLITVRKHEVDKIREEVSKLGIVFVEHDWTPRRGVHPQRKVRRMIKQLEEKLMWAFCSTLSNQEYLHD